MNHELRICKITTKIFILHEKGGIKEKVQPERQNQSKTSIRKSNSASNSFHFLGIFHMQPKNRS
jgi:hypothetical protein